MSTVSPLTNQLLIRNNASAPTSVREPALTGFEPSSGGGWKHGAWKLNLDVSVRRDTPSSSVEPGADMSVRNSPTQHVS